MTLEGGHSVCERQTCERIRKREDLTGYSESQSLRNRFIKKLRLLLFEFSFLDPQSKNWKSTKIVPSSEIIPPDGGRDMDDVGNDLVSNRLILDTDSSRIKRRDHRM